MEPFRYKLVFDTALNPAGADAAEAAIRRVDDAASRATRTSTANDEAIRRAMTDNAAKARVSEFAYYDLDAAVRRNNASTQAYAQGQAQLARGTGNASRSLLVFSQGLEDAQYGVRGVLNNIPGLVMALGGTAGLAGALSIAAVAGSVLYDWLGKTEQKAGDAEAKLKELGEKAQEIQSDKIAQMTQGLWDAWDAADATRQNFEETKKAADSFATSALSDAEKIRQAQQLIADVLGIQVDHFKTLEQQSEANAQKRQLAAEQAMRQQQELIQASQDEVARAAARLETAKADQQVNMQALATEKAKLAALEQQHEFLSRLAKERMGWNEALATEGALPYITETPRAEKAREKMEAPGYASLLESVRARVKALEEAVGRPDAELNRTVVQMENELAAADTKAQDKMSSALIKIQELQSTLDADTTLAEAQTAVDKSKLLADGLKEAMSDITARTDEQQEAKDNISKAAADGKITADELTEVSRNLTTLVGGLQSGMSTTNENVAALINLMVSYQSTQSTLQTEIKTLKANYDRVKR